ELRLDLLHALAAGLGVGGIPFEGGDAGLVAKALRLFLAREIGRGHRDALLLERAGDCRADAARAAGHHSHSCHVVLPSFLVMSSAAQPALSSASKVLASTPI